jgi:hypothetical protein
VQDQGEKDEDSPPESCVSEGEPVETANTRRSGLVGSSPVRLPIRPSWLSLSGVSAYRLLEVAHDINHHTLPALLGFGGQGVCWAVAPGLVGKGANCTVMLCFHCKMLNIDHLLGAAAAHHQPPQPTRLAKGTRKVQNTPCPKHGRQP